MPDIYIGCYWCKVFNPDTLRNLKPDLKRNLIPDLIPRLIPGPSINMTFYSESHPVCISTWSVSSHVRYSIWAQRQDWLFAGRFASSQTRYASNCANCCGSCFNSFWSGFILISLRCAFVSPTKCHRMFRPQRAVWDAAWKMVCHRMKVAPHLAKVYF